VKKKKPRCMEDMLYYVCVMIEGKPPKKVGRDDGEKRKKNGGSKKKKKDLIRGETAARQPGFRLEVQSGGKRGPKQGLY